MEKNGRNSRGSEQTEAPRMNGLTVLGAAGTADKKI